MTLKEVSMRFCMDLNKLRSYEANGLLPHTTLSDGTIDYRESDIRQIGFINKLFKSGMTANEVKSYHAADRDGQLRILRKQRCVLLDEIHGKQQLLDEMDYLIEEKRKG